MDVDYDDEVKGLARIVDAGGGAILVAWARQDPNIFHRLCGDKAMAIRIAGIEYSKVRRILRRETVQDKLEFCSKINLLEGPTAYAIFRNDLNTKWNNNKKKRPALADLTPSFNREPPGKQLVTQTFMGQARQKPIKKLVPVVPTNRTWFTYIVVTNTSASCQLSP